MRAKHADLLSVVGEGDDATIDMTGCFAPRNYTWIADLEENASYLGPSEYCRGA